MIVTLLPLFSLLLSCFIMMMGFGLTGLLMPVRMGLEGMNTDTIGMVLSMYAAGMLFGGLYARVMIIRAGHIRMFAAVAALAAISVLACGLSTNPWLWGLMRMLMGFCMACALAAIDSWLSESASQETRGRILAANQIVIMGAFFVGQFLINLSSPSTTTLFIVAGMLLSLALIPIVMSRKAGPSVAEVRAMSMMAVFRLSPLGVVSCFFCGILYSGMLNMLPIFAGSRGIEGFELSLFMGAAVFGAFILQFPVGYLSDHFDRRTVLFGLLIVTIGASVAAPLLAALEYRYPIMAAVAVITGIFACLYPMSISETFDKVLQSDMVAAMGGLIATYALGSIIGPYASSLAMKTFGNDALFGFLAVMEALLLIFVVYRMRVRDALPVEDQEKYVLHGVAGGSSLEIDPRFEYEEPERPLSPEAETVVKVAQNNPGAAVKMAIALAENSPEQAAQLAAALSCVEQVDIARLYAAITEAAPELSLYIAEALAAASPEQSNELIDWLIRERPDQLAEILVAIAEALPEQSVEIIGNAAETMAEEAPEMLFDMAETYASHMSEQLEEMRPVDRAASQPEHLAAELYARLAEIIPERAADLAYKVAEAMPEAAIEVAEAYVHTLIEEEAKQEAVETDLDSEMISRSWEKEEEPRGPSAEDEARIAGALTDFVNHVTETMPEQAVKIAAVLVESRPDLASDLIERLQSMHQLDNTLASDLDERPAPDIFADYPREEQEERDASRS
ncbi:MFS transporter [Marinobacterium aestuariivivens]|uniref:MFS transporter n=1 Tax=Marinobacterium aestuariivivens TaxID=1698799 RepID=A0ABW1ZWY2_9GAMM